MRTLNSRLALKLGIVAAMAALAGCNSMSAQECQSTDWRTVGYEDGVNGFAGDRIGRYRNACSEHGVTPDLAQYQAGRDQGLTEFCKSGRQLYVLRSRVGSTHDQIYSMRAELDQIDRDLVSVAAQIVDPTLTAEQRAQLVVDTKHLAERKGELKARIPQLEGELVGYQRELEDYRATLSYIE